MPEIATAGLSTKDQVLSEMKKIKTALISVFHKEGLDEIAKTFIENGVTIYSTGGTANYLRDMGAKIEEVADLTEYPSILDGRVKTLHPKVFGGILARTDSEDHQAQMEQYNIPYLDCVIVDLYPFEETVASGADHQSIIEKIDIGGISLIRAAAKNYNDVAIVSSREQYAEFAGMVAGECSTSLEQRQSLAAKAFAVSSRYDTAIQDWMSGKEKRTLRYGENPHQQAWFIGNLEEQFEQLQGKEISYNNLVDVDAALNIIDEFEEPCFAIIKHTNPCGLATAKNIFDAWKRSLECDPTSAFGGILAANREVTGEVAAEMADMFFEVLIAPSFTDEALEILAKKKNRRVLKRLEVETPKTVSKSMFGGLLVQETDGITVAPADWEIKTSRKPTETEISDMLFGEKAVKHQKSNAIAIVKNGQLIGGGVGQTSRVDALKQAIIKAEERGFDTNGAVLASDAFFPFADSVEIAHKNGISVVIQPGGSVKDEDTVNFCESHDMCLVFTKVRHFRH